MVTCLCDAFFDDAARATVEVLEHLGCSVVFPTDQSCCGQPAFNSGDWDASRRVVRHALRVFPGDDPVVVPSGSCAAMLRHGALLAFEKEPDYAAARSLAARTWELADFIVNGLGIASWPGRYDARVAFHRSCHTRGTDSGDAAVKLLSSIEGLELVSFNEPEQCCGFGGTFSVTFPNTSEAMGLLKLGHIQAARPEILATLDLGCSMHLHGLARRQAQTLRPRHLAQILRDALREAGILGAPEALA